MKIVAKAMEGKEFLYNPKSAHKVSVNSGLDIMSILNMVRYDLKDGETWFLYDIDQYDVRPYEWANRQRFTIRNGIVKRVCAY